MENPLEKLLSSVAEQFLNYLPNLLAGITLIGIGWVLGWFVKRVIVQVLAITRIDRIFRRFRWATAFGKADVRYALFESIGDVAFVIVFLFLLDAAFEALHLKVLSTLLERGVVFIPKVLIACLIFGFGWILAAWIAGGIQRGLTKEEVPRASLIGRFAKTVLMLFFSAMALTQLDIAREIVVIGFSTAIITLGLLSIVLTLIGGKKFVAKLLESFEE